MKLGDQRFDRLQVPEVVLELTRAVVAKLRLGEPSAHLALGDGAGESGSVELAHRKIDGNRTQRGA
jgi:hypothetical protein